MFEKVKSGRDEQVFDQKCRFKAKPTGNVLVIRQPAVAVGSIEFRFPLRWEIPDFSLPPTDGDVIALQRAQK
jgi:hypothetical protein